MRRQPRCTLPDTLFPYTKLFRSLLLYRIFDRQVMAGYSRVLEMLDEAMNAAGVLPGLTFVPVRARATAQGEQETHGKPAPPAGATGDAHGTTSASAGEGGGGGRSEEHTSELQSLMRISYAVFCLKKK